MTFNNSPYVFWILPQQLVKHSFELENCKPKINKKDDLTYRKKHAQYYTVLLLSWITCFTKNHTPEDLIEQLYKSALETCLVIVSSQKKNWSSMLTMWKHDWTHAMDLL